jgi:hypothetical protein
MIWLFLLDNIIRCLKRQKDLLINGLRSCAEQMAELPALNIRSAPLRYANQTFDYRSKTGRQLSHYV